MNTETEKEDCNTSASTESCSGEESLEYETQDLESCSSESNSNSNSSPEPVVEISETSSITVKSVPSSTTTDVSHQTNTTTESKQARREKSSHNLLRYQKHILALTNNLRRQHNVQPLTLDAQLNEVARLHNADIALSIKDLSHVSSDGSTLTERLLRQGYDFRYASENLARGQRDCRWVMKSWMKSAGHRRNILSERVKEMGLHVGVGHGKMYWTQVFGLRRGQR